MAMRASALMAGESFARLRRRIAEIEGRSSGLSKTQAYVAHPSGAAIACAEKDDGPLPGTAPALACDAFAPHWNSPVLAFGVARVDRMLRGGLCRNALHEIRGEAARDAAAVTGFASAVLARLLLTDARPVLWVVENAAACEGGLPHGPGLDHFGLDSSRLIVVRVRRPGEALWVFEEGLRCGGLAAVLTEIRGHPRLLDLTASRRLALRARESGVMGLLLRQSASAEPGAATTRWRVAPRPTATLDDFADGIGKPAWRLNLERNRAGTIGTFDLEWDHGRRCFACAEPAALSVADAPLSSNRPHPAHAAGAILAFRRVS